MLLAERVPRRVLSRGWSRVMTKSQRTMKHSPKPSSPTLDAEREERILMEIVVDAYDEVERAMGWHCYLDDKLRFPFTASCIAERSMSPIHAKDEVEVIGMAPEDDCMHEVFVRIRWEKRGLTVPLSQLKPARSTDDETRHAVEDWHHWVKRGYCF